MRVSLELRKISICEEIIQSLIFWKSSLSFMFVYSVQNYVFYCNIS